MSFRNTFVTSFIYQAADDVLAANQVVTDVFSNWANVLDAKVNERGYGYYAGWFKTLSGTLHEAEEDLRQIIPQLENATKVPFFLTIFLESAPQITYEINPHTK
jgi:hypothetical protein